MNVLYHYTNAEGLGAILRTKQLLPSLRAINPKDARYGDGQYVTDIQPDTKRPAQLSAFFLRTPWLGRRFTHYVAIDVSGLEVRFGRKHVYVIPSTQPLDLSQRIVRYGQVNPNAGR